MPRVRTVHRNMAGPQAPGTRTVLGSIEGEAQKEPGMAAVAPSVQTHQLKKLENELIKKALPAKSGSKVSSWKAGLLFCRQRVVVISLELHPGLVCAFLGLP